MRYKELLGPEALELWIILGTLQPLPGGGKKSLWVRRQLCILGRLGPSLEGRDTNLTPSGSTCPKDLSLHKKGVQCEGMT